MCLQCCALLQGVRAISTRKDLTGQQIAHVHTQELNLRASLGHCRSLSRELNAQLSPLSRRQSFVIRMLAAIISPHQLRRTQPGPSGCSNVGLEGLGITPLEPVETAMRVVLQQLLGYSARPLPRGPYMTFPPLETVLSRLEGGGGEEGVQTLYTPPAHLASLSFLRLTMSHVVKSVGVKHISETSGESTVVSGHSPGYPHVWSKHAAGCVLEHTQATM